MSFSSQSLLSILDTLYRVYFLISNLTESLVLCLEHSRHQIVGVMSHYLLEYPQLFHLFNLLLLSYWNKRKNVHLLDSDNAMTVYDVKSHRELFVSTFAQTWASHIASLPIFHKVWGLATSELLGVRFIWKFSVSGLNWDLQTQTVLQRLGSQKSGTWIHFSIDFIFYFFI